MAPRIPPAARTLVTQVLEARPDTEWEPAGEPDGYRRHRTVRFVNASWLDPVLEANHDKRIAHWYVTPGGDMLVTFVGDTRADRTQPFQVKEVLAVVEEPKPAAKKPAKKAARKRAAKKPVKKATKKAAAKKAATPGT